MLYDMLSLVFHLVLIYPLLLIHKKRDKPILLLFSILSLIYLTTAAIRILVNNLLVNLYPEVFSQPYVVHAIVLIAVTIFYFIFKQRFASYNYFTLAQYRNTFKRSFLLLILANLISIAYSYFYLEPMAYSISDFTLLPIFKALDYILVFQGLSLGLMATIMNNELRFGRIVFYDPRLVVNAIFLTLFFTININDNGFEWADLTTTVFYFVIAMIHCYMVTHSRSVLMSILSFSTSLLSMQLVQSFVLS